jgi:8-oxo-dGTP pyrophosphatase MutT (NUDIX family)
VSERVETAGVCLLDGGRLLAVRHRANAGHREGMHGLPAGRQVQGEPLAVTAARELREETGLDVPAGQLVQLPTVWESTLERPGRGLVDYRFTVFAAPFCLAEGELAGSDETHPVWVTEAEIGTLPFLPNIPEIVAEAIEALLAKPICED